MQKTLFLHHPVQGFDSLDFRFPIILTFRCHLCELLFDNPETDLKGAGTGKGNKSRERRAGSGRLPPKLGKEGGSRGEDISEPSPTDFMSQLAEPGASPLPCASACPHLRLEEDFHQQSLWPPRQWEWRVSCAP